MRPSDARPQSPHVVIAGAGFAGLTAMRALRRSGMRVTLVDRNAYSTFQPLLYQVATAGLTSADVAYPAWTAVRKARASFRMGEITGIDTAARQVKIADGGDIDYDFLILATGVGAAYFGIPGAAGTCLGLYTRRDAIVLRNRLMAELQARSVPGDDRDLSVTVVGGGATGVEMAGTLAELRNIALPASFPEVRKERVRVRLVELGPVLLPPYRPSQRAYARTELLRRGVEVILEAAVKEVRPGRVVVERTAPGETAATTEAGAEASTEAGTGASTAVLPSDITIWAAGVSAPEWTGKLGLPTGRGGRIRTGPDLRVAGEDRIFAAGDLAVTDDAPLAQLAQPAIQHGRHAAAQIIRLAAGQPTKPFSYRDKGIMATIGHRSAVVELPSRLRARGTLAWLAWLGLHLITLLGGRNRISAFVNLAWRYLTWSRGGGVIIGDDER